MTSYRWAWVLEEAEQRLSGLRAWRRRYGSDPNTDALIMWWESVRYRAAHQKGTIQ